MKIILLSGSIWAVPTMHFLANKNMLQAVVSTGLAHPGNLPVEQTAAGLNMPFKRFSKSQLLTGLKEFLEDLRPDLCLTFAYGYKIPAELMHIPKFGFFNVHFSLLPAYRGRCPVFWQLKNGENTGGVTIHRLAEEYDAGKILLQKEIPIHPGENHGTYSGRLSLDSVLLIAQAIEEAKITPDDALTVQDEQKVSYAPALALSDLNINWDNQSASEIENLVNASNPDYGGATVTLRGQVMRILEVNSAALNGSGQQPPGTIVYSDMNNGIFVACKNMQYLRINITHSPEGILSGFKLASLGIQAGERFENIAGG